jgi:hypothetical protein
MSSVWSELLPLALASMVVPVQWTLTILIVRASPLRALAFVAGNVTVRLLQGLLFFVLVPTPADAGAEQSVVVSWLLMLVGTLLLVKAARSMAKGPPDEDAPPPAWVESAATMSARRPLVVIAIAALAPSRSAALLDAVSGWLTRNTSRIVIGICLVVGLWFVAKALTQLL